jgi:CRP-like cAMP-binding protein
MVAVDLQQLRVPDGERIFTEGDVADALYLVAGGKVGLYRLIDGRKMLTRTVVKGGIFGVTSVVDGGARIASAVALEASLLVRMPTAVMHQKMDRADPLLRQVVGALADQLRDNHRVMQMRPRSVPDYLTLLQEQVDNLGKFLINTHEVEDSVVFAAQIKHLQEVIDELRRTADTIRDRREDAYVPPHKLT